MAMTGLHNKEFYNSVNRTGEYAPRSARRVSPALRALEEDLSSLARAEAWLTEARSSDDSRDRFEKVHRACLRAAGVWVAQANRARKRPLPSNVWRALEKMGSEYVGVVEEFAWCVRLRDELARDRHATVPEQQLQRQEDQCRFLLRRVRHGLLQGWDEMPAAG